MASIVPFGVHSPDGRGTPGLTAVVPCYNEVEGIDRTYAELASELSRYDLELLFVDDGSTDGTLAKLKALASRDPRVRYISFTRNFGQEAAFGAGFRYASRPWVAQVDADLQSPATEIHRLLDRARQGGYDVVFGTRRNRQDPWLRRIASRTQHWIARRVLGIPIHQGSSTFRVVRTSVARKITDLRLGTPYFIASVALVGARATTVATEHRRREGRSRFAVRRLFTHALDLFFGYSLRPFAALHVFAGAAGLALLCLLTLVAAGATVATPAIVAAITVQLMGLCGLAVLGRYVMGLVREAQPFQYLVREANVLVDPSELLYEDERIRPLMTAGGQS